MDNIILGSQIQKARKKCQITQQQMAEKLGTNEKYISNIETGKSRCSLTLLIEIANLLGVGVDCLLGSNLEVNELYDDEVKWLSKEYINLTSSNKNMVNRFIEFLNSEK